MFSYSLSFVLLCKTPLLYTFWLFVYFSMRGNIYFGDSMLKYGGLLVLNS